MRFEPRGLKRMLKNHGVYETYTSKGEGTYVVGSGFTEGVDTLENILVYYSQFNQDEIDGQSVQQGDRKAVFVPTENTVKPKNGDTIGNTRVEGVREIMSGSAVVYICQVRDYAQS